jgi:hypothetical protein
MNARAASPELWSEAMKRAQIASFAAMMLLGLSSSVRTQESLSPQLAAARSSVEREIQEKMPGWVRRPVTPIAGSGNTIIDQWELGDFVVKIAIEMRPSQQEAEEGFDKGKQQLKVEEDARRSRGRSDFRLIKEKLTDVGQDGYTWEDAYESEAAAFRENNLIVYVSVVRPTHNQDKTFSKEFARHVAKALRSM